MRTDRLIRLADYLDTVPPEKYNQEQFVFGRGEPACALGHACVLFKNEGLELRDGLDPTYGDYRNLTAAEKFFDLSWAETKRIFAVESGPTPADVAKTIRSMI